MKKMGPLCAARETLWEAKNQMTEIHAGKPPLLIALTLRQAHSFAELAWVTMVSLPCDCTNEDGEDGSCAVEEIDT